VLPLVPGYLSAVGASSVTAGERGKAALMVPATIFCASFTLIFVVLGMFAQQIGGRITVIEEIAGILLIVMGVFFLLTPFVTRINREWRPERLLEKAGSGGPVIAGAAFAVGWTPCTGPILGAILTAAAQRHGVAGGAFLLLAYSGGLAIPFLLSALAFERFSGGFRWLRDHYTVITVASGVILIAVGILVFLHKMPWLAAQARDLADSLGLQDVLRFFER
jgi:cytochrome c-type biogenesis protein